MAGTELRKVFSDCAEEVRFYLNVNEAPLKELKSGFYAIDFFVLLTPAVDWSMVWYGGSLKIQEGVIWSLLQ